MYIIYMRRLYLIAHNVRSAHNVGSLLRTAEGLGVEKVYLSGYTPYPEQPHDKRLPHVRASASNKIQKTALGAETMVEIVHREDINTAISDIKKAGFTVAALEQSDQSTPLNSYTPPDKIALLVGPEVSGLSQDILKLSDAVLEIPMLGRKESFNVASAASMALFHLRFAK